MQVRSLQGDTVDAICHRHLGQTAGATEAALKLTAGLAARGPVLPAGVLVNLPALPAAPTQPTVKLWD